MSTQIEESLFTEEQQTDMRGLLAELLAYFYQAHRLFFKDATVQVTPHCAALVVPVGKAPGLEEQEASNAYTCHNAQIQAAFDAFYREHNTTGSSLICWRVSTPETIERHFKLIPNDILGTENTLRKLLIRLRARL